MSFKKFVFGTDSHGDMICPETSEAFLDFTEEYKPFYRIHGGDVFDFRPLRGGCGSEEKSESMKGDVMAGLAFLDEFRPNRILRGNHDERLWEKAASWTDGIMRDLCENLVLEIEGHRVWKRAEVLPYDSRLGILKVGDLQFAHGYHCGMYSAKAAIQTYKSTGTGLVMGHVHRDSRHEDHSLTRATGITVSALCRTDMSYNSKNTAKLGHSNGWLFGEIHSGGEWEAWNCRKVGKSWLNPIKR